MYAGTSDVKKNEQQCIPIAMVQRRGTMMERVSMLSEKINIHIKGEKIDKLVPREDFETVAELILHVFVNSRQD